MKKILESEKYEEYEEEVVEMLIYKCKLNRNDAYEVAKNRFYTNYMENVDLYNRYPPEEIAKGFVEDYMKEYC